jgi:hypothetical protein
MHPYRNLPEHAFWRRAIAGVAPSEVDPVVAAKFIVSPADKVVTAGSCFAQHIARHLAASGFNYLVTETAHPAIRADEAERYNYRVFSARYGNVYTSRQFIQLLQRAYGEFTPADDSWPLPNGRFADPFRPQIQPDGFASLAELHADRAQHFAAIRRAVEELDIFVFTLGLTEGWLNKQDGAAYPLCPGVAGGTFDPAQHAFVNLSVRQVTDDMRAAIDFVKARNPAARFILTVSPVPLIATIEDRSVLVSTTYSKSVLRVAAEELARDDEDVAYFPSYEVITGSYNRGAYFAEDLRSVTEEGVAHVMRLFMRHYTSAEAAPAPTNSDIDARSARLIADMQNVVKVICDEESLDQVE